MKPKTKRVVKIVLIVLGVILFLFVGIVGGYVAYVAAQYYRIPDNKQLEVENAVAAKVQTGEEYSIMTYNLGFGAYSPEYTFFMDTGVMDDGKKVSGKYAKGISKADVEKNVSGQLSSAMAAATDFYFFQEADEKADRSYGLNMCGRFKDTLDGYCSVYAENFHTANLLYPFNDPIGKTKAGIMTFSRYAVQSSVRRSFPITDKFIDKLFDLDRCFSVSYLDVEGQDKQLVLINLHMSAYDEGGKIRAKQLDMLNTVLKEERDKGNYIVAGGDFNHCLIADKFASDDEALNYFPDRQQPPDWVKNSILHNDELTEGFRLAVSLNEGTCRGADIPYEKGVDFVTVIDGFIVSDNVQVVGEVQTVDTQFAYSDHNPVKMTFKLV